MKESYSTDLDISLLVSYVLGDVNCHSYNYRRAFRKPNTVKCNVEQTPRSLPSHPLPSIPLLLPQVVVADYASSN